MIRSCHRLLVGFKSQGPTHHGAPVPAVEDTCVQLQALLDHHLQAYIGPTKPETRNCEPRPNG